ncbi:Small ubiquitin-related modifier 2 isoform B [Glycine soja]|uniref:Small ubiquitin-related modifier n=1 Tax=Glycine soja TaxID=3848 RepID=A0A445JPA0_GLYSO|nr:Small ubiquitin-related modifier 2 isoform B [Glycine soja]
MSASGGRGSQEEEKKPSDQGAHINLKVKGQDGNEVFFRIKRSTQLKKLMNAYCDRQSVDFNSIAFLFDGRRLRAEQTPDEVNLVCSSLVQTQVSSFNCCKVQFCYYAYSLVELSYTKVFKMIL